MLNHLSHNKVYMILDMTVLTCMYDHNNRIILHNIMLFKCCLKLWNPFPFNAKMWNLDRLQVDIPITYIFLISHSQLLIFWNERCNFTIQFSPSCFNILEWKFNTNYIGIRFTLALSRFVSIEKLFRVVPLNVYM